MTAETIFKNQHKAMTKKFRDFKGSFSDFWLPTQHQYKSMFDNETKQMRDSGFADLDRILKMSSFLKAVHNFVKIVTTKNIPVKFSTNDASFTDGRAVTISGDIQDSNFDSNVGLALHEASHIKLTDFSLLHILKDLIPQELYDRAQSLNIDVASTQKIVKDLLNWVEDRRIDNFMYTTAPGYRGYYQSFYNRYFYSDMISRGLASKKYREESLDSYNFRIINLMNPDSDLDALRGLREINTLANLSHIDRLVSSKDSLQVALDIFQVILKYLVMPKMTQKQKDEEKQQQQQQQKSNERNNSGKSNNDSSEKDTDSEPQNSGWGTDGETENESQGGSSEKDKETEKSDTEKSPSEGKTNSGDETETEAEPEPLSMADLDQLINEINKQKSFLDGKVTKASVETDVAKQIEKVSNAGSEFVDVKYDTPDGLGRPITNKIPVIVIRNVTEEFLSDKKLCDFSTYTYRDIMNNAAIYEPNVVRGIELGKLLGRRLQIRNEDRLTHYTRKESGKIERRLLAELGFSNESVFSRTSVEKYNRAFLHISIDNSGSMQSSNRFGSAIQMSVAIAKFAEMTKNIDVVISFRSDHDCIPLVVIMYDSRKDKFSKVRKFFPYMKVIGSTPEGLAFAAIQKEIESSNTDSQSYFINLSDGEPSFTIRMNNNGTDESIYYEGDAAFEHTRKEIEKMRVRGIKVMSYYIGSSGRSEKGFNQMYGRDAHYVDTNNVVEIAKSLEKMFSVME